MTTMNEVMMTTDSTENSARWAARVTVADGLFVIVAMVAAVMRLVNLDSLPLSPDEATQAWQTWAFWRPETAVILTGSPAYFTLTTLSAQVMGYSDSVMRLVPALFGVGVVLLPWLGRRTLGTVGALVTSALLALSPLQVVIARTVGGDASAIFALLLLVMAYVRWRETAVSHWPAVLLAAVGLGLATSPLFYSGIVTLGVAWGIHRVIGLPLFPTEAPEVSRDGWKTAVFVGLGVFIAAGSMMLWHPAGLGAAARQSVNWFSRFSTGAAAVVITDPFLATARYEPILVTLGLVIILWASWRSHPLASFCIYWIAAILLLILAQRGVMSNAVLLTLPGFLMIGLFANELLKTRLSNMGWLVAAGSFLMFVLTLVNLARYVRRFPYEPEQMGNVWMIVFAFAMGLTILYFILSLDIKATYQGTLLGLLGFFLFFSWGTSWWLGHHAANDTRERWVTEGTDDDVRMMIPVIQEVSQQAANSIHDLDILSSVDSPVLRWYLRDYERIQFSDTLPSGTDNEVIITPTDVEPALGSDYMGGDYGLTRQKPATLDVGSQVPLMDTLRWWFFQESPVFVPETRVILWLRADILAQ
ncbi:MAG: glycosyltransferase family 39 protein [Anaerolineales bacterium]|nr:glycosyltransferase family 39 protein [Anaerolineales bacterium]